MEREEVDVLPPPPPPIADVDGDPFMDIELPPPPPPLQEDPDVLTDAQRRLLLRQQRRRIRRTGRQQPARVSRSRPQAGRKRRRAEAFDPRLELEQRQARRVRAEAFDPRVEFEQRQARRVRRRAPRAPRGPRRRLSGGQIKARRERLLQAARRRQTDQTYIRKLRDRLRALERVNRPTSGEPVPTLNEFTLMRPVEFLMWENVAGRRGGKKKQWVPWPHIGVGFGSTRAFAVKHVTKTGMKRVAHKLGFAISKGAIDEVLNALQRFKQKRTNSMPAVANLIVSAGSITAANNRLVIQPRDIRAALNVRSGCRIDEQVQDERKRRRRITKRKKRVVQPGPETSTKRRVPARPHKKIGFASAFGVI